MNRVRTTAGKDKYRWDYQELRYLVYCLQQTKDFRETFNLFLDLHTQKEISEIIRRILIASLIDAGATYEQITSLTGASSGTVARIQAKLSREKSMLAPILRRAGNFESFEKRSTRDPIQRRIDRVLDRSLLGVFFKSSRIK